MTDKPTFQQARGDITGRDRIGDQVGGDKITIHIGSPSLYRSPQRAVPSLQPPSLPARYVPRPDLLAHAKANLFSANDSEAMRVVGLVGMGGVGKSVLARALIRDEDVRRRFPSGIIWLEIGPDPDLPALQAELAEAFGDPSPIVDVQQGRKRLTGLLAGAECLLVLDNVWEPDHLRAFNVSEPTCTVIVTTRNQDVLDYSATACSVDLLADSSARALLAAWAGDDASCLPVEADEVVKECGGLPLALAIAGGLVAEGRSWRNVRERLRRANLDKLVSRFPDYPYPNLLRALDASAKALSSEQRDRYLELAILEGRGWVPVGVLQRVWGQAGLDDLDSEDLVVLLAQRSLIQYDREAETVTLHDLQLDYLRGELRDEQVQDLHARIAAGYLIAWGGMDQRLPNLQSSLITNDAAERYGLLHLVHHLAAAGLNADIHRLLSLERSVNPAPNDPALVMNIWCALHDQVGETGAYLADVRLALNIAEMASDQVLEQGGQASSIGLELRYGLMLSSIVSIASNIPAKLLIALLDDQLLTPAHALAYARELPTPLARIHALVDLAAHLPQTERVVAFTDALHLIPTIDYPSERVDILASLAPYLPKDRFITALDIVRDIDDSHWRGHAVAKLASYIPTHLLPDALDITRTVTDWIGAAQALADLAPHLPPDLLNEAISLARAIEDPAGRAQALVKLAPRLPQNERHAVLTDAVTAASAVAHPYGRASDLMELAPQLPADLLRQALDVIRAINDSWVRVFAATQLAPLLPANEHALILSEALSVARTIESPSKRVDALVRLISDLSDRERLVTLTDALNVTRSISEAHSRSHAIIQLASRLPANLLSSAVDIIAAIDIPDQRAAALTKIAIHIVDDERRNALLSQALKDIQVVNQPDHRATDLIELISHLPAHLLPDALNVAQAIESSSGRARALTELASYLPEDQRRNVLIDALEAVRVTPYRSAKLLIELISHLPADLLPSALGVARAIKSSAERAQALTELASYLPEDQRRNVLVEAFNAAHSINDTTSHWRALAELARKLPEGERHAALADALDIAQTIESASMRAKVLTELSLYLPDGESRRAILADALEASRAVRDPSRQAEPLLQLIPRLPPELISEALDISRTIVWPSERARVIIQLAANWSAHVFPGVLDICRAIDDPYRQAQALADIAPHLPADLLPDALDIAQGIKSSSGRAQALTELASRLPECQRREFILKALEAAQGIDSAFGRTWALMNLAPHLAETKRQKVVADVLAESLAMEDPFWRLEALSCVAPHVSKEERRGVLLEVLNAIRSDHSRSNIYTLLDLAPHLTSDLLSDALEIALSYWDWDGQIRVLPELARRLPTEQWKPVLRHALNIVRSMTPPQKPGALIDLAPHLHDDILVEALRIARAISFPYHRAEVLIKMAPQASGSERRTILVEGLDATHGIESASGRAQIVDEIVQGFGEARLLPWSPHWRSALVAAAIHGRASIAELIGATVEVVAHFGGPSAIRTSRQALIDVQRWWP